MKRWYLHELVRQHNPTRVDLEKVYRYYIELHHWEETSPPGIPVATHIAPFQIDNGVLTEAEVETELHCLRVNRAGTYTHMRAENFKTCLMEE